MIDHIIPGGVMDITLERYVMRAWPMVPAFAWRALIKKRDARVNGVKSAGDALVRAGDRLMLFLPDKYAPEPLDILYEDGALCAFVKPRGLPTDADAQGIGADTALTRLRKAFPNAHLAHRLDVATGGVMLAALNDYTKFELEQAFRARTIDKIYQCVALGAFDKPEDTLSAHLIKDARASKVRVVNEAQSGSAPIRLGYNVLETRYARGVPVSRLEIKLYTGRTHQIRAQLASIGHPLIGDDKYGDYDINKRLGKSDIMLWCASVTIGARQGLEKYEGMRFSAQAPDWELV